MTEHGAATILPEWRLPMRPVGQPIGARDDIAVFEKINNRMTLEVYNNRALGLRLPPTPIIDPDDSRTWCSNLSRTQ
jgi:hypothetical protein